MLASQARKLGKWKVAGHCHRPLTRSSACLDGIGNCLCQNLAYDGYRLAFAITLKMYGFREKFRRRLVKEMDNRISYYIKRYRIFPLLEFSLYMRWSFKWVSRLSSRYDGLFGNWPGSVHFYVTDASPANNRGTRFARIEGCCYGLQLFQGFKARGNFYQSNLYFIIKQSIYNNNNVGPRWFNRYATNFF